MNQATTPTVAEDAIAAADSYLNNALLPTYTELLAALQRLMDAPRLGTNAGMKRARENAQASLAQHAKTMSGDFK